MIATMLVGTAAFEEIAARIMAAGTLDTTGAAAAAVRASLSLVVLLDSLSSLTPTDVAATPTPAVAAATLTAPVFSFGHTFGAVTPTPAVATAAPAAAAAGTAPVFSFGGTAPAFSFGGPPATTGHTFGALTLEEQGVHEEEEGKDLQQELCAAVEGGDDAVNAVRTLLVLGGADPNTAAELPTTTTTAPSDSLFGAQQPAAGGLFGAQQPAAGGLFGAQQPAAGGLFGAQPPAAGGLFGAGGGLFGAATGGFGGGGFFGAVAT
eukprot:gene24998-13568_t